jgi:hypothetical protein
MVLQQDPNVTTTAPQVFSRGRDGLCSSSMTAAFMLYSCAKSALWHALAEMTGAQAAVEDL